MPTIYFQSSSNGELPSSQTSLRWTEETEMGTILSGDGTSTGMFMGNISNFQASDVFDIIISHDAQEPITGLQFYFQETTNKREGGVGFANSSPDGATADFNEILSWGDNSVNTIPNSSADDGMYLLFKDETENQSTCQLKTGYMDSIENSKSQKNGVEIITTNESQQDDTIVSEPDLARGDRIFPTITDAGVMYNPASNMFDSNISTYAYWYSSSYCKLSFPVDFYFYALTYDTLGYNIPLVFTHTNGTVYTIPLPQTVKTWFMSPNMPSGEYTLTNPNGNVILYEMVVIPADTVPAGTVNPFNGFSGGDYVWIKTRLTPPQYLQTSGKRQLALCTRFVYTF